MSVHINLLQNQKDYTRLENTFRVARVGIIIFGVVCLVTLIVVFALKRNAQASLDQAIAQRNLLQQNINSLQDQEARIVMINEKMTSMNAILNELPDYSREVETFLAYVPSATESGQINRIALDARTAQITMSFPSVLELSKFITVVESDNFQTHFKSLTMGSIQLQDESNNLLLTLNVSF
jgi:hypothetical protein